MLKRGLLVLLGAGTVLNGGFMLAAPLRWYEGVPGVEHTGPFNAHFVLDIGLASIVAGLGLLLGAWRAHLWPAAAMGAAFLALHGGLHLVEMLTGPVHGAVPFEVAAVLVPAALAVYAAWPAAQRRAA
ncbi:MAG: hypothetical protein ACLFWF_05630 [Alphaproteobacteria bacterium]